MYVLLLLMGRVTTFPLTIKMLVQDMNGYLTFLSSLAFFLLSLQFFNLTSCTQSILYQRGYGHPCFIVLKIGLAELFLHPSQG